MFEKIAQESFFLGAQSKLASLNLPSFIKEAALRYLIKEAGAELTGRTVDLSGLKTLDRIGRGSVYGLEREAQESIIRAAQEEQKAVESGRAVLQRGQGTATPNPGRAVLNQPAVLPGMELSTHVSPAAAQEAQAAAQEAQAAAQAGAQAETQAAAQAEASGLKGLAKLKALAKGNPRATAAAATLAALGIGGGAAYGMGAFDEEPALLPQDFMSRLQRGELTTQEKALLAAGGAATVGGLGYGASQLL